MATRMQQRRGTATQWTTANPILNAGELGWESDTNKFKIGDGVNHWADLTYFSDNAALTDLIDGAPALLDTLNELAAAIGDDPAFFTTVATNLSNHEADTTNIHGIANTAELATKTFAAELLTNATKSNITITGDKNGLTITAENGVADSTTDNLTEGSTNKYFTDERAQDATGAMVSGNTETGITVTYDDAGNKLNFAVADQFPSHSTTDLAEGTNLYFTDERAQDAVGLNVGTGLTYTDSTGEIKVTPNTYDAYGAAATAETNAKAYADALTTSDVAEGTGLYFTDERAQDAVGNNVGTGLSYDDASGAISVNTTTIQARVSGVSDTEIGYLDGVTSAIQTQLDEKLPKSGGTMSGAIAMGANKITGLGTPTADTDAATKLYVDNVTAGINFHQAVHVATTANLSADYNNGTDGVGATLTASANGAWPTIDGHSSFTQYDRILVKDQTDAKQNGIYVLSDLGSGSSKWILTRATDADNNPSGEMKNGDFVLVLNGTANASYGFVNNSATNPIVIGTDNITYTPFNAAKTIVAGNGLQESTPGTLSIDTAITADVSTAQTLTNKTISGASNTLTVRLANDVTGTLPVANGGTGITSLGTGVATFLGTPSSANLRAALTDETGTGAAVFADTPTLVTPVLGEATATTINGTTIPTSKTLVVTTDKLSALAATTSAELAGVISDETGTGALVFANSPTLVTPALGTPSSATLTNATGLPVSTGISGLGTGVATALAVNVGSAGAPVVNGGALGTPSSGTLTNATGLPLTTGVTGTLPIANGGTGQTTASAAANALLPSQTSNSGKYLTTDGAGTLSWGTVSGYSAPTLGSTSIASGATVTTITGLTENNLTLTGTLTAGASTGTSGQVLASTGTGVQWTTPATGAAFSEFMLIGA